MFWIEPKETILKQDEKLKVIELCIYCDKLKQFTEKWEKLGYSVNHGICKECSKEYFN